MTTKADAARVAVERLANVQMNISLEEWSTLSATILEALAKPASEPAGGDVRTKIARIIDPHSFVPYQPTGAPDDGVFSDMVKSSLGDAYRKADRIIAALSSSAGPAVEPAAWQWRWQFLDTPGWSSWEFGQPSDYVEASGRKVERRPLYAHPAPATEAAGWAAVYDGQMKSCHRSRDTCVADAEHYHAVHPVYLGPAWRHQED